MMNEASPRPWQVRYGDTVADATGAKVAACWRPENALLIVTAVNQYEWANEEIHRLIVEKDNMFFEAVGIRAERDRLRDALNEVCSRVSVALNCPRHETEQIDLLVHDLLGIKECARAAIGEDKP